MPQGFTGYSPIVLSHQTGLSGTSATASAPVIVGNTITIPRQSIITFFVMGHVSAGTGEIDFTLTRNSTVYYLGGSASSIGSLFGGSSGFSNTSESPLLYTASENPFPFPLLTGDILQFRVGNLTASDTTYLDDLTVMMQ